MEPDIEQFLNGNHYCFDRFTFDNIFRFLLRKDFSHEEAKDAIVYNCALSAIVFQERIDNSFYEKITVDERISADLQSEINAAFNRKFGSFN